MSNLQRKLMTLIATMVAMGASADDGNRRLVCSSTYGDPLGQTSVNVCTAKRYHFYDVSGNTQAVVNRKTNQGESEFMTVDYNSYKYNSFGQLASIDVFQYGLFDFQRRDVKASPAASSSYEYDENGNMVKEVKAGVVTEYEYDADGNVIKEVSSTGKTVEYADFSAGKNKYAKAVSTHSNTKNEGEFYDEYVNYDANGNKISALRYYNTDTSYTLFGKVYGHQVGDFMSCEEWTYDENGIVLLYRKSVQQDELSGDYLWNSKIEYERVDGNVDRIRRVNYDARYVDGEPVWSRRDTPFVDEYCCFDETGSLNGLEISAIPSESVYGDVLLTVDIPQGAIEAGVSKVNVYRNGELVNEITDVSGLIMFEDHGVRNGSQEYFVTLTMPSVDYAEYCCSNKAVAEVNTPLPKARNLSVQDKAQGTGNSMVITIGYDYDGNPDNSAFGYQETFLIVNGGGYPDDNSSAITADPYQRTLKRDFEAGRELSVQVVTRYALGTVLSEPLVFDPSTVEVGISDLVQSTTATEYYDLQGRRIAIPDGVVIMKSNGVVRKVVK